MESPLVGQILAGKYRVTGVIGEGGMGVVLAATHVELDERVAIKVLRAECASNADLLGRFINEGRAAAKITSDHIVRVRDVGRLDDGQPYMVMEYLVGEDLSAQLARGPLPVDVAVDHVLEACDALADAHAAGIVHRDLKPSNLFLVRRRDGTPSVKVLDFGISKLGEGGAATSKKTSTQEVFGSPAYMSPEQLVSTRDVDARSDLWSLGIVLYELLTGATPFDRASLPLLHVAILNEPPRDVREARPDVPAGVAATIQTCLAKSRDQRFPDVITFAEALAPFASARGQLALTMIRNNHPRHGSVPQLPTTAAALPSTAHAPQAAGVAVAGSTLGAWTQGPPSTTARWRVWIAVSAALAMIGLGLTGVTLFRGRDGRDARDTRALGGGTMSSQAEPRTEPPPVSPPPPPPDDPTPSASPPPTVSATATPAVSVKPYAPPTRSASPRRELPGDRK